MKKLYSLALGLLTVAISANAQTVTIGETSYNSLNDAYAAAVDGDILTINGTVEVKSRVTVENKSITIIGADENAQLKRPWGNKTMLIKAGNNGKLTIKNITWSGSTVEAGSSFESSAGTAVMTFENVRFIEINQVSNYTIDQKGGGTVNINGLVAEGTFAMNGDAGWTVREGNDNKVNISGINDFCIYVQNNYLLPVSNLENSNIIVGFDIANDTRMKAKRAIVRGTGDANQMKSGMPGYALVKEGNKDNLRIELAPLAITCNGETVEGNDILFDNGSYNFTITNAGTGIEYSYKFTEAAAQTYATEDFIVFDPTTGITVDKEGTLEISAECANMNQPNIMTRTFTISKTTGIDGIVADENAPVEYYNLQGIRVENPENGIFIRRQGSNTTKVAF